MVHLEHGQKFENPAAHLQDEIESAWTHSNTKAKMIRQMKIVKEQAVRNGGVVCLSFGCNHQLAITCSNGSVWIMDAQGIISPLAGTDSSVATFTLPLMLSITVEKATGLSAEDADTRSSDPYCIVKVGEQRKETATKKKTLEPVFNEKLDFELTSVDEQIRVEVWDSDSSKTFLPGSGTDQIKLQVGDRDSSRDDFIGQVCPSDEVAPSP